MANVVNRIPMGADVCSNCKRPVAPVIGWTSYSNDGGGWQGTATIKLCQPCLLECAEMLDGVEFREVYASRLRAEGIAFGGNNATLADLRRLCIANGLAPEQAGLAVVDPDAEPDTATPLALAKERATAAGVPLVAGYDWTAHEIDERVDVWANAARLGIDLYDGMMTDVARDTIDASLAARAEAEAIEARRLANQSPAGGVDAGNTADGEPDGGVGTPSAGDTGPRAAQGAAAGKANGGGVTRPRRAAPIEGTLTGAD